MRRPTAMEEPIMMKCQSVQFMLLIACLKVLALTHGSFSRAV